jgi:hypothetical protein
MTDFTLPEITPRQQTVGLGASIAAALIVAAIVLTALKVSGELPSDRPSLIPLDQPAAWSGFIA